VQYFDHERNKNVGAFLFDVLFVNSSGTRRTRVTAFPKMKKMISKRSQKVQRTSCLIEKKTD
jgi:hypothetical protein